MSGIEKPTPKERLIAAATAAVITFIAAVAFLFTEGILDGQKIFGICGFEQKHGIPCPTCRMTRSVIRFVSGDILGSFKMQPAAAFLCVVGVLMWFYSVATAAGASIPRTKEFVKSISISSIIIALLLLVLLGWAATLIMPQ